MAGVMPASGLRSPSGTGRGRTGPDHRIVVASPGVAGRMSQRAVMGANMGGAGGSSARAPRSSVPIVARSSSGPPTMHGVRVMYPSRSRQASEVTNVAPHPRTAVSWRVAVRARSSRARMVLAAARR